MNMQEMASVWRTDASNTARVIRRLRIAAMNAAMAPMAELSTRLVQPLTNGTIIEAKITTGRTPARNRRNFSPRLTWRSSFGSTGPSSG